MAGGNGIFFLYYRIPQNSGMPNPSNILRRIGFRVDGSVWVVRETDLPYRLFQRFDIHGVTWNVWKFDNSEAEKLTQAARESIEHEVREIMRRAGVSAERLTREMQSSNKPLIDRIKKHKTEMVKVAKRIAKGLKDLKQAASRFGFSTAEIGVRDTRAMVNSFRENMRERARVFLESCNAIEAGLGKDDPMLKAAKNGGLWMPILADYMQDKDIPGFEKIYNLFD